MPIHKSIKIRLAVALLWPFASCADDIDLESEIPVVLTPTRLRQSLPDVPASVSIITAKMIAQYGIRSIPDALRLVPGMAVTQVTGSDYRINYHGTNVLFPRRMNILLDGMAIYGALISRVRWKFPPVAIEDIERIEVTRGSNSATYGSNSMLAVINIITKHPNDVAGTTLSTTVGSMNTLTGTARYGGNFGTATTYRVTIERDADTGFDYASSLGLGRDSRRMDRLNFRSLTNLSTSETLDVQASFIQGVVEAEFVNKHQRSFPDINVQNYFLSGTWKKNISPDHEIQMQGHMMATDNKQSWMSCIPTTYLLPEVAALGRSNPTYMKTILAGRRPSGGSPQDDSMAKSALAAIRSLGTDANAPICGDLNQDFAERRYDAELQDTFVFSEKLRMVNGIGLRHDQVNSETLFDGRVSNNTWRTFTNIEYKPVSQVNINAGGFFEKDNLTGSGFSPRMAFNIHLNDNNTIRFIASKAVRMPDFFEQRADWAYRSVAQGNPNNALLFLRAISPRNLRGEKSLSKEIGYFGNFPQHGILIDAKIFEDKLTDLISEKLQHGDFKPTNNNWVRLRGAEFQVSYTPTHRWSLHFAYSNLNNRSSTILEQTQYAQHSGALGVTYAAAHGWNTAFAIYQYLANANGQSRYGREDLTISKSYRFRKNVSLTPSFTVSHLDNRSSTFFVDTGKIRESRYNHSMQYFAALKLNF